MVYARLLDELHKQFAPAYEPVCRKVDEDTNRFGKRQLERLRKELYQGLHRRSIRAIVVDNVHFVDQHALSWIVELQFGRNDLERQRAIILVRQHKKQKKDENQVTGWLKKNSKAVAVWLDKLETTHLKDEDLAGSDDEHAPPGVLEQLLDTLLWANLADQPENLVDDFGNYVSASAW
jgi:hypothetical protein